MTRERAKELLPIIQAFSDGKCVQWRLKNAQGYWSENEEDVSFECPSYDYRIKPTPKLRPWKPEEVPVGAAFRAVGKTATNWAAPVGVSDEGVWFIRSANHNDSTPEGIGFANLCRAYEYTTDGKTWQKCGILENQ